MTGEAGEKLPRYTRSFLGFQLFNAVNFTIAIGTPMVLLAKYLGAGESMIGVLISLTPFFSILQLPSTTFAERWGYKRLMLAGWRTRTYLLFLLCPLPFLAGKLPPPFLIAVMFLVMLGFNLSRGFSSGSWLPWLLTVIPEKLRGTYIGVETRTINSGVLITLVGSSILLGSSAAGYKYGLLAVIAAIAGIISLRFIQASPGGEPVKDAEDIGIVSVFTKAAEIWRHRPFMMTTTLASACSLALSAIPGFLIVYLKDRLSMADSAIMLVSGAATAGSLIMGPAVGRLSDRFGSRPLMRLGLTGFCALLLFWLLVALGKIPVNMPVAAVAHFLWGVTGAAYGIPLVRFLFGSCPPGEANVGMSVFQVVTSVFTGAAPLLWGFLIEFMHRHSSVDPFVVMFSFSFALLIVSNVFLTLLKEPEAIRTVAVIGRLMAEWPAKLIAGFKPDGFGEN